MGLKKIKTYLTSLIKTLILNLQQLILKLLIFIIRCYQYSLSYLLGHSCKFNPTCSNYAILALKTYGLKKGIYLSTKRILKCHPYNKECGDDPLP